MDDDTKVTPTGDVAKSSETKKNLADMPLMQIGSDAKSKSRRRGFGLFVALILVAIIGFGGGFLGGYVNSNDSNSTIEQQKVVMSSKGDVVADIAKNVGQSVVSVNVTQQVKANGFFGSNQPRVEKAAGTGIIISNDGLILTNRHVVPKGTSKVSVTLSNGKSYDNVKVVGRTSPNDSLDIAFIKIQDLKGEKLTAAKIGDSSKMKVGDPVVAIGNALGQFQNTVTSGILSGYGRSVTAGDGGGSSSENLENLFQTDAAINQGNSGGPLVNLAGQVVGVNVAIADNAQSVGFAIPINDVKGLISSVEKTGELERPYLGVAYLSITADIASNYGLNVSSGAYIAPRAVIGQNPIVPGSPADKAGLKAGDIITAVDGQKVDSKNSLTSLLGHYKPGDKVSLSVLRSGKTNTISATLGKFES